MTTKSDPPDLRPAVDVADLMAELRAELGRPAARTEARALRGDVEALARRVQALRTRATVYERPFVSAVPRVGGAIARFRDLWNSVSTKWYVRPMVQQQNELNLAVLDVLEDLARQVALIEARLDRLDPPGGNADG